MTVTYNDTYLVADKKGNTTLKAPIEKGAEVGAASYEVDGKVVYEAPVYAGRDVAKGNIFSTIGHLLSNIFTLKGILTVVGIIVVLGLIFVVVRIVMNRKYRRRGGYSFGRPARRNTGLTMNLNGKKTRTRRRRLAVRV